MLEATAAALVIAATWIIPEGLLWAQCSHITFNGSVPARLLHD